MKRPGRRGSVIRSPGGQRAASSSAELRTPFRRLTDCLWEGCCQNSRRDRWQKNSEGRSSPSLFCPEIFRNHSNKERSPWNVLKPATFSLNVTNVDASVTFYEKVYEMCLRRSADLDTPEFDHSPLPSLNLSMVEARARRQHEEPASTFRSRPRKTSGGCRGAAWSPGTRGGTHDEEDSIRCLLRGPGQGSGCEDPDPAMWEVFVVKGDNPTCAPTRDDLLCAYVRRVARTTTSESRRRGCC